ncbi:MAG: response regulator [Polyangiales bacterium]
MSNESKKNELISTGDAARACGVSTQTIVNWIRQGRLRAATTGGGRFRVHSDSLVEFLKQSGFEVPTELKSGPLHIFVVDDDPVWLSAAKRQLSSMGQVDTFADGYKGLVAIVARPPDLVVLDMKMPGLDGASVLTALRNEDATCDLPILVVTSYEEEAALALRYGASASVIKGNAAKLKDAVDKLLL